MLEPLEAFREEVHGLFDRLPDEVAVVLHPRRGAHVAHPWLPLARMVAAPASRRYFAGWFTEADIHVLSPPALERRASTWRARAEALLLSPLHEYSHLAIGMNNPDLPPPFSPSAFRRYVRWAWLCEGAAVWLSGQTPYLRPAIVRRLREEARPEFPPSARDAMLLGGTIFSLLQRQAGPGAAARSRPARSRTGAPAACSPRPSTARSRPSSATGAPSSTRYPPPEARTTSPLGRRDACPREATGQRARSASSETRRSPTGLCRGSRRADSELSQRLADAARARVITSAAMFSRPRRSR